MTRFLSIALALIAAAILISIWEAYRWEKLDRETLIELSKEQNREVTYGAAKWNRDKIEKLVLRGPNWRETRYPDGRIESK